MRTRELAETWLNERLIDESVVSAGSNGLYRYPAPVDAVEPFITVALDGIPESIRSLGKSGEKLERIRYRIEAWDRGESYAAVADIAAAIYAAINGVGPVGVTGGSIIACTYLGNVNSDVSVADGVMYQRGGGIYELFVKTD